MAVQQFINAFLSTPPPFQVSAERLIEAFDKASREPWTVTHPGERDLDMVTTVKKYLDSIFTWEDRQFAIRVLCATRYVSWPEFITQLNASFDAFVADIGTTPFYVYLPTDKFGSEAVLIVLLWSKIRRLNFKGFIHSMTPLQMDDHVLVVDDAIYSGTNMIAIIDQLTDNNPKTMIHFHLVVPYVSDHGESQVRVELTPSQLRSIKIYGQVHTKALPWSEPWPGDDHQLLADRFQLEFMNQVPLYFDHKVGNNFASFPSIYLEGIVPGRPNFGSLLPYPPDNDLKSRVHNKYFKDVLPPPSHN